jgi:CspA family cold shock protein
MRIGAEVTNRRGLVRRMERRMVVGTVKWFNSQAGYGYIQPRGGGRDVFVHLSSIERAGLAALNDGQLVEFEIEEKLGQTSAVNLRRPLISRCE